MEQQTNGAVDRDYQSHRNSEVMTVRAPYTSTGGSLMGLPIQAGIILMLN